MFDRKLYSREYYHGHKAHLQELGRSYYYKSRAAYIERAKKWGRANPDRIKATRRKAYFNRRDYIVKLKSGPCADCNNKYPFYVMDFDHRDPKKKLFKIGGAFSRKLETLKAEIAKCDVVCSNCHRIRSYKAQIGVYKYAKEII